MRRSGALSAGFSRRATARRRGPRTCQPPRAPDLRAETASGLRKRNTGRAPLAPSKRLCPGSSYGQVSALSRSSLTHSAKGARPAPSRSRERSSSPLQLSAKFVHKKEVSRKPDNFIFAGCQFIQARNRSEVPCIGHASRRTYKTIATDHCGVPDDISAALLGHVPEGMSQKY